MNVTWSLTGIAAAVAITVGVWQMRLMPVAAFVLDRHLVEYELTKAQVLYQACFDECHETCRANGVTLDACNCDHCKKKYLED